MSSLIPWLPLIGPALAAFVAIVGLGVTHALTSRRDLNAEKRKIRINFMIEAYRKLEAGSSRGKDQEKYPDQLPSAIADIQLLGSPEQVEVAKRIAWLLGTGSGKPVTINELLVALRSELRKELNLEAVGDEIVILRNPEELSNKRSAKVTP
jgi:hypothetical protein